MLTIIAPPTVHIFRVSPMIANSKTADELFLGGEVLTKRQMKKILGVLEIIV